MAITKPTLLAPVALQVREREPELPLACVTAKRGVPSVIRTRQSNPSLHRCISDVQETYSAEEIVSFYLNLRKPNNSAFDKKLA